METIAAKWESFWKAVAPKNASPIQQSEMRRAFYAGAWGLLQACIRIGEPDIAEDAGVDYMEQCDKELKEFYALVGSGKA